MHILLQLSQLTGGYKHLVQTGGFQPPPLCSLTAHLQHIETDIPGQDDSSGLGLGNFILCILLRWFLCTVLGGDSWQRLWHS